MATRADQVTMRPTRNPPARLVGSVFDVTAYEAAGDDTGDDTVAIQAAIDAAELAGGGVVYFPAGTYKILGAISVQRSNVSLVGHISRPVLHFAGIVDSAETAYTLDVWDSRGGDGDYNYDNTFYYEDLDVMDDGTQWGGNDYRLSNIVIKNLELNVERDASSNWIYPLRLLKVDGFIVKNVKVSYVGTPHIGNGARFLFCSNGDARTLEIGDNTAQTYGLFLYWSHGLRLVGVTVGEADDMSVDFKHVVKLDAANINITRTDAACGLTVGYGSKRVNISNLTCTGCYCSLSAGNESEWVSDVYISGVDITNETGTGLLVSRAKNTLVRGATITAQSPVVFQQVVRQTGSSLTDTATANSDYYVYDHDYDTKAQTTLYGTEHWRYYTLEPVPVAKDFTLEQADLTIPAGQAGARTAIGFLQAGGPSTADQTAAVTGNCKTFETGGETFYCCSAHGCTFRDITINGTAADTPDHYGIYSATHALEDCTFDGITFNEITGRHFSFPLVDNLQMTGFETYASAAALPIFEMGAAKGATIADSTFVHGQVMFLLGMATYNDGIADVAISNSTINCKGTGTLLYWHASLADADAYEPVALTGNSITGVSVWSYDPGGIGLDDNYVVAPAP